MMNQFSILLTQAVTWCESGAEEATHLGNKMIVLFL